MIRVLTALALFAGFTLQASAGDDPWSRGAALYHQRLQQAGIVGSSLMFVKNGAVLHRPSKSGYIVSFNTDVASKREPRLSTRAVDDDLRDAIIREMLR